MDVTIGFYAQKLIKIHSFMKIWAFSISAVFQRLCGTVAAPGRRRRLEDAEMGQKVHKDILVTEPKAGAPAARRFRAIYDIPPGGVVLPPPILTKG